MPPDFGDIMQATHGEAEELPVFFSGKVGNLWNFEASESGKCVSFLVVMIIITMIILVTFVMIMIIMIMIVIMIIIIIASSFISTMKYITHITYCQA